MQANPGTDAHSASKTVIPFERLAGYVPDDYLPLLDSADGRRQIMDIRRLKQRNLVQPYLHPMQQALLDLPGRNAVRTDFASGTVRIGDAKEMDEPERLRLSQAIRALMPWKKGPYELFGHPVDAEWRSDLKWNRIQDRIAPLRGRRIADIGCNSGYFMFRMAHHQPDLVIGFEPSPKLWYEYHLLQRYARVPSLHYEMLGVADLELFPGFFDTIFLMGIIYHVPDPIGILQLCRKALRKGGELIIESQSIPGHEPLTLIPEGRYAGARGIWFVPTAPALRHMLVRAGFREPDLLFDVPLTSDEQRRSTHAPVASLADFLDPRDPSRTVEGYPAPRRAAFRAELP